MKNYNTMLHMKLNSAVSVFSIAAAFAVFLPPSNASAGICFLPDCMDEDVVQGDINMNINSDTEYCEEKGYTYYSSGECPQYYAKLGTCSRDDHYLKCDAVTWCKNNGYNTQTCSIPQYVDGQCPNGQPYYKQCKTDNQRACRDTGYTNSCPSGQKLKKNSGRCAYDTSYGTCCKPSGCPSYTSLTSSSYGTNGTDGCEYTCYYTCNMNCPSGTSTSNPGGCGGSTRNGCGTKTCYYPYKACCTPSCSNQYGCSCGTYTVSNGCGGTCTKCSSCCTPKSNETGCSCGTYSCSDGCGGTRKCCSTCSSSGGGGGVTHSCCSNYHDQFGRPWNSSLPTYWVCPEVWPEPNCQCWDGGKCRWKTCEEAGLTTGNPTGTCTRISDYPPNCYRCGASSFIPVIIK